MSDPAVARRLADWSESDGPALWWRFPVAEPPYVGTPIDDDWPGYHTHWTPIVVPVEPRCARCDDTGEIDLGGCDLPGCRHWMVCDCSPLPVVGREETDG